MAVGECMELSRRRFPPKPASVGDARRMIREGLRDAGREDLAETAELLVSEIVTNALVHAGTTIEVACSFLDGGLRIEVSDGSPHAPSPRDYGPSAGTGRGLMLLEEMVEDWGVVPGESGKTVWFTLGPPSGELSAPSSSRGEERPRRSADTRRDTVDVQLLAVPLLLHEAWRQHAESLLREYLLASLDLDGPEDPIEVHAEASGAISLLAEHIPASGVGEDLDQVMVTATEPHVTRERVSVPVPHDSLPHFDTLDRTLRRALRLVQDGDFLTPPTQPEMQSLRGWLCGEVRRQGAGEAPAAWMPLEELPEEIPEEMPHPLRWDTDLVTRAATGMVAADDADRIVAVSGPALVLLGYAAASQLVGRRLVSIIPARYRQAHLAGFTMHFLSGRSTLVDREVVVPALRSDGSEVAVSLTIHRHRADDGRTVFVADLRAA